MVISRLSLGHCGLNHRLALVGENPDGNCSCGGEAETVNHALMEGTNYHTEKPAELS